MAYLSFPGTDASATTPRTAAQDVFDGNDFDLRLRVRHTNANFGVSTTEMWVRFGTFNTNGVYWRAVNASAFFQAFHSGGATNSSVSLATLGLAKDVDTWVRVVYSSTGNTLAWYSSTDDTNDDTAVSWGTAKATTSSFSPTWTASTLDPWRIGAESSTAFEMTGRIHRLVFIDNTPTRVFDADFSDPTTWTYT